MYHAHKVKSLTCDLLVLGLYLQTRVAQVFDPVQFSRGGNTLFWYEKGVTQLRLIFCKKSTQLVPSDCSWWPRPLSVPFLFPTSSNLTVTLAQPLDNCYLPPMLQDVLPKPQAGCWEPGKGNNQCKFRNRWMTIAKSFVFNLKCLKKK